MVRRRSGTDCPRPLRSTFGRRINAVPELRKDDAVAACRAGALGIFVPNASTHDSFRTCCVARNEERKLQRERLHMPAMIEDAGALLEAHDCASRTRARPFDGRKRPHHQHGR